LADPLKTALISQRMVTITIGLAVIISIFLNIQSMKACFIAELPEAVWKELYKMAVNIGVLIFLYTIVWK